MLSAVASQAFTGVFTSAYENYQILINITSNSANDGNHYIRLRSATTDATTDYVYYAFAKTTGGSDISWSSPSTFWKIGSQDNSAVGYTGYRVEILRPQLAQRTPITWQGFTIADSSNGYSVAAAGSHTQQTAYDGFNLITENGTITGTVSVYGYNK